MRTERNQPNKAVSPALLTATSETLRGWGPGSSASAPSPRRRRIPRHRRERAGHHEDAIRRIDHLGPRSSKRWRQRSTRRDAGREGCGRCVLICAHRGRSDSVTARGINESILVLLLRNIGDDLVKRAIDLWKPLVRAARSVEKSAPGVDPARASEWIVRMLLSFELSADGGETGQSARGQAVRSNTSLRAGSEGSKTEPTYEVAIIGAGPAVSPRHTCCAEGNQRLRHHRTR